ncbi:MAG: hypothetical protein LLG04_13165, partial [Parachlamydia sp.]|nr:hypothetical protein [Parachlamydia sp.]
MVNPNPVQNVGAQPGLLPAVAAQGNPVINAQLQALPANNAPLNGHQAVVLPPGQPAQQGEGWWNWGARQAAGFGRGLWTGVKKTGQYTNDLVVTPLVGKYVTGKLQEHSAALSQLTNSAQPLTAAQLSDLLEPLSREITKLVTANVQGTEALGEPVHLIVKANLSKAVVKLAQNAAPAGATPLSPEQLISSVSASFLGAGLREIEPIRQELENIEGRAITPEEKKAARVQVFKDRAQRMIAQLFPGGKDDLIFPEIPNIDVFKRVIFYAIGTIVPAKIAGKCEQIWTAVHIPTAENLARARNLSSDGDAVAAALRMLSGQIDPLLQRQARDPQMQGFMVDCLISKFPALLNHRTLLQNVIADLIQYNRIPVDILASQGPKLAYPLLLYVLSQLIQSGERGDGENKPAALAMIVNSLLTSIFQFSDAQRQQLAHHYQAVVAVLALPAATPDEISQKEVALESARKNFGARFEPLVNEGLQKAGLSLENISRLLPIGANALYGKMQSYACKLCVDFYEECVVRPSRPEQEEGRNLLKGLVHEMMPAIRESLAKDDIRRSIQQSAADWINKKLFNNATLPLAKEWIAQPIKELMESSTQYPRIEAIVEPLLVDSIGDLIASLSNNGGLKAGLESLMGIVGTQLGNAASVVRLQAWIRRPEGRAKEEEREAIFGPFAEELMRRAGWDRPENIRVPKAFQGIMKVRMRQDILPYILCRISCDLLVPKELAPSEQDRLAGMGGHRELRILCAGLAEVGTPKLMDLIKTEAGLIAGKINEKLSENRNAQPNNPNRQPRLNNREEVWLGGMIRDIFTRHPATPTNSAGPFDPLWPFVKNYLTECLNYGLSQLALNYRGRNQGGVENNIAFYLRDLIKGVVFDARLAGMIRNYHTDAVRLKALDREVAEWRNRAIQEGQAVTQATLDQLQRAKHARANVQINPATHQALLLEFEPRVRQLLIDMGFPTASDLPVPFFLKEVLWKNLTTHLLPDLCLTEADKVISAFDELMPSTAEINNHADVLHSLYQGNDAQSPQGQSNNPPVPPQTNDAGEQQRNYTGEQLRNGDKGPLVAGIFKLAEAIVKQVESKVALQGAEVVRKFIIEDKVIPNFYGVRARDAALLFDDHQNEIARWMGEESPEIAAMVKERLGKSLRDAIAEPHLKGSRQFIENIKK